MNIQTETPSNPLLLLQEVGKNLCSLPHRASATPCEGAARTYLESLLKTHGHEVTRQPFRSPRTYGWELIGISLAMGVGGLLASPWLALLGFAAFWVYFSGWPLPWRQLVDRYPSENLLARAGAGPKTLVLMAHVDTAKSFFAYHPKQVKGFRRSFLVSTALGVLTVLLAFVWPLGARFLGAYFLAYAALLLHREFTAPLVNGANDNASGVAVATQLFLDLSSRLSPEWKLVLALTGCEEVGTKGAAALVREKVVPRDALVLNIDNVGRGELHYAEGEGMLAYYSYKGTLLDAARALEGARPLAYRLAYFDTLPFVRHGYDCLTLVRLEDGVPPHWHWPSDTAENVDLEAVSATYWYVWKLISHLGVTNGGRAREIYDGEKGSDAAS